MHTSGSVVCVAPVTISQSLLDAEIVERSVSSGGVATPVSNTGL